ncbi:hypothetical protein C1H46_011555 [Malus baccata]|uniref:Uncharacterized protein n=1 Tax=Malus baccata TaxID=106549 RepID=A0A540MVJ7_MALBA|nr:hypothetical protein C1H46_011555 [Malus baccata]
MGLSHGIACRSPRYQDHKGVPNKLSKIKVVRMLIAQMLIEMSHKSPAIQAITKGGLAPGLIL